MASRLHSYLFRRTLRVACVVIFSLAVAVGIGYALIRGFSIQQVEVDGQGMSIELDKTKLGENLLFIPTDKLRGDLLSAYPLLSTVRFEKRFPGTLIIHLVKRLPFAVIVTNGATYSLDGTGVVLDNAAADGLFPILAYDIGPLVIGNKVTDSRVHASLVILDELKGMPVLSRMTDNGGASILATMDHTQILFPQNGDMRAKADTLQTIVEGFRIKGALPGVIDLRFAKPIVTN